MGGKGEVRQVGYQCLRGKLFSSSGARGKCVHLGRGQGSVLTYPCQLNERLTRPMVGKR